MRYSQSACLSSGPSAAQQLEDELHLLHDVHHRLTPIEAARLGKELEH
jgi:mannonate dehydratase